MLSVTRSLVEFVNIWAFTTMLICPKALKISKSGSKFFQILFKPLQKGQLQINFSKVARFCQIWSHFTLSVLHFYYFSCITLVSFYALRNIIIWWVAAIAPWFRLRLSSSGPGFESPKHTIYAYFNLYWNCNEKRTKINKKRPGLARFFKKTLNYAVM